MGLRRHGVLTKEDSICLRLSGVGDIYHESRLSDFVENETSLDYLTSWFLDEGFKNTTKPSSMCIKKENSNFKASAFGQVLVKNLWVCGIDKVKYLDTKSTVRKINENPKIIEPVLEDVNDSFQKFLVKDMVKDYFYDYKYLCFGGFGDVKGDLDLTKELLFSLKVKGTYVIATSDKSLKELRSIWGDQFIVDFFDDCKELVI